MRASTKTLIVSSLTISSACTHQQVSYKQDVSPILDSNCSGCHTSPYGYGYKTTGLEMDSYDSLMQGTIYGPVVIAGDSRRSILNKLVERRAGNLQSVLHTDEDEGITEKEVETLKIWVDQGALNN